MTGRCSPHRPAGIELLPVDDVVLSRLVAVALADAAPDEVTPPLTPGDAWTQERVDWLRRFHSERGDGLDGPQREATWAVSADGAVVGAVRLKRVDGPGVVETGIWLTRGARGQGTGRAAMSAVLDRARELGAREVRADTSRENAAALFVLQRLRFRISVEGDRVAAVHELR